jgi:hypothetical protein
LLSKCDFMAEKSAIPSVTILVPFLVLQNSKFPLTSSVSCFCNLIRFVCVVSTIGGGLPAWLGDYYVVVFVVVILVDFLTKIQAY